MALVYTPEATLGMTCPDFKLPSTDGGEVSSKDMQNGKPFLVMFLCNHCPYVKAIEDRLIQLGRELVEWNVPVVAICSNDAEEYPEDSFENLKKRAHEKLYPFPYLHDETQEVAKAFGAVCTPDFFLFDAQGKLAYRGRLDDSWKDASRVRRQELREAIRQLLQGHAAPTEQVPSMGCSIKWKENLSK